MFIAAAADECAYSVSVEKGKNATIFLKINSKYFNTSARQV
jgi:hypothetical protein